MSNDFSPVDFHVRRPREAKPRTEEDEARLDALLMKPSSETKPTNPKDIIGSDKLPLHLWPTTATAFGCIGMVNGAFKYGRANFREAGIKPSIYVDACKRHLDDWFEGNDYDPEDGVHNLSAALACLAIIVDAMMAGKMNDDRNYNGKGYREARGIMEPHVKRLRELNAHRVTPKHYTIADKENP